MRVSIGQVLARALFGLRVVRCGSPTGNLKTMIEFGPKLRSTPVIDASKPVRMALTPMMVPVPMITPSTVRNARSLCAADGLQRQHDAVGERELRHRYFSARSASIGSSLEACRAG